MAGEERIKYLADAVRYHRELYYNHSAPEISDAEFDPINHFDTLICSTIFICRTNPSRVFLLGYIHSIPLC